MRHDVLVDAITVIKNAEIAGKSDCLVPASEVVKNVLKVMKSSGYIKSFNPVEETEKKFKIQLLGKINNCKAIRPRFSTGVDDFEKFEKRFLPSKDIGIIIISTSKGVMTHKQAKEQNTGGSLLAFVY
jgi:small subunit ribosomal protein S8